MSYWFGFIVALNNSVVYDDEEALRVHLMDRAYLRAAERKAYCMI